MGANAVTTVPVYVSGEVLTAADLNITNSGIPVFATTVTRDAAFGGTGEKTLAEGQFAYIEATKTTQYYDGAVWQSVGVSPGLVLVKTQTIGSAVSTVTVTDAFSSTHDNYLITVNGGAASGSNDLNMTLGATSAGYYTAGYFIQPGGSITSTSTNNGAGWLSVGAAQTTTLNMELTIYEPNLAKRTIFNSRMTKAPSGISTSVTLQGYLDNATQYTDFTLGASAGTLTGGTIRVYGYANS
jgi:hypothetical protein